MSTPQGQRSGCPLHMVSPEPRTESLAKQVPDQHLLAEWPKWQALVASQAQSVPLKGPPYMRHCCFLRWGWTCHFSNAFQGGTGLQLPLGLDSALVSLLSTCWRGGGRGDWKVTELGEALGQCPGQGELFKEDVLSEWERSGAPQRGLTAPEYEPATTQTSLLSLL